MDNEIHTTSHIALGTKVGAFARGSAWIQHVEANRPLVVVGHHKNLAPESGPVA